MMDLIDWNATITSGRGRTGTVYTIARLGRAWTVAVDGDVVCSAPNAAKSVERAEGLEALKHIVHGRGPELDLQALRQAESIAAEMKQASDAVSDDDDLPEDEREAATAYSGHLATLLAAIDAHAQRRSARPLH
jgi:hypothetical protein